MFGSKPKKKETCCECRKSSDRTGIYVVQNFDAGQTFCYKDPMNAFNKLCDLIAELCEEDGEDYVEPTIDDAFNGDFYGSDVYNFQYANFED